MELINGAIAKIKRNRQKKRFQADGIILKESSIVFPETQIMILGQNGEVSIGDRSCVRGILVVDRDDGKINIGKNSYIGENTRIWSAIGIKIGDYVNIAHNCNIFDNDTHPIDYLQRREDVENIIFKGKRKNYDTLKRSPIVIEDDVWIGCNVSIMKGVHIGKGAIVAAGSVVVSDVPSWTLVAGIPAKIKKKGLNNND
jgi:acetyltransferase-like isoleucine patch superfamily enzyme